ncbi:MAG TPA: HlyD family secretion protein [Stellaceae bacterium]|jgi:membrane fusion protein (multidrug efflux system)
MGEATMNELTAAVPEPQKKRRPVMAIALGVIGAIVLAGAAYWFLDARYYESTDDAFIDAHIVHVSPQIAGRVAKVLVDDNQMVQAGQVLIEIDSADAAAKLAQAQASAVSAAGKLAQAQAQSQVAQATLEQMRAESGGAQANAANASTDLKRYETLARSQIASVAQLDNARALAISNNATLAASTKKIATSEAQVQLASSQVRTAEADLAAAQAQVDQAKLALSYTEVVAPEAGRVTQKSVATGNFVQMGQDVMALVPSAVWVTANFKETQLAQLRVGEAVSIAIDAYPGQRFEGHIDSLQAGSGAAFALLPPENATGNYVKVVQRVPVKIVFDKQFDQDHVVGAGMSVVPTVRVR